jgi:CheY-like chemotaxis protein
VHAVSTTIVLIDSVQRMKRGTPAHVLVVEDNRDTQLLLQYFLRAHCTLEIAAHVEEALRMATGAPFDVFILDINLGEERTGIELLQLLRSLPLHQQTPALALTAYAMPGDRERFLSAGFDRYISKPFTRQELLATLLDLITLDE